MPSGLSGWLAHIESTSPSPVMMGLDRVSAVWRRMGVSLEGRTVITVGGTNGKGSCAAMADSILGQAGYRTMLYSSPHLVAYNERVRIRGVAVADELLCDSFAAVEKARLACGAPVLTYFEFGTLAAAWCAAREDCEALVLEVGLGGRLDAVNVFDADVAVITMVAADHVDYLGSDREQIGWEKAHIMRADRPAVIGERSPPGSVRKYAREIGAAMHVVGKDFAARTGEGGTWSYSGMDTRYRTLPSPALRGRHQLGNAATALAALETQRKRLPLTVAHVRQGLLSVRLRGRTEVIAQDPCTVLDVAHNPSAAAELAGSLLDMGYFPRTVAIFGIMADKDVAGVVGALADHIDLWLTVPLDVRRGANPRTLAAMIREEGKEAIACDSVPAAKELAHDRCTKRDRILVFGSFLTVGHYLESAES